MKLLLLESTHRDFLIKKCALRLDKQGNEILAGLSHQESKFYLKIYGDASKQIYSENINDLSLFLSLHEKHANELSNSLYTNSCL